MKAWFIWVEREPAWKGYLPKKEHHTTTIQEVEKGAHYSTDDAEKAEGFDTLSQAQRYIDESVHPHLRPFCTPTSRR